MAKKEAPEFKKTASLKCPIRKNEPECKITALSQACVPPQFLADQLSLSQLGGQIMPNYYWHPRIFRPSDGPGCMFYRFFLKAVDAKLNDINWLK
jgi:hypothetical protein